MSDTRLEEIKETLKHYINDAHGDGYDTVELPIETYRAILQELEKLQQENERYKEVIKKAFELDGYIFLKEALEPPR